MANSLEHAAAIVRKEAVDSMVQGVKGEPSPEGTPPHKVSGKLSKSIAFQKESDDVILIGPQKKSATFYGALHEHGGTVTVGKYRRKRKSGDARVGRVMKFPPRPFMAPALINSMDRIPYSFRGRLLNDDVVNT
jgi:phage gpG-like protein